jgi:hypothetical protein
MATGAWTFKIFPSIGIARLGNSPGSLPTDYYIGPEIPSSVVVPSNGYKDSQGRIRRQAARFRIYGWEDGVPMGEITSANANITWTVELANRKAAYNQFQGIGHTGPLRNGSITDRSSLMIQPGPRSIDVTHVTPYASVPFNGFFRSNTQVTLGEIQTDPNGRLIVLGGFGNSGSPTNAPLTTFANNDGWYDDVSDGPVNATIVYAGQTYQASGAWVICPPPRFAPPIPHQISLYDTLLQSAIDKGNLGLTPPWTSPNWKPSFTNDVYPILRSQFLVQWVSQQLPSSYYSALQAAMSPAATYTQRNAVFQQFRPPSTPNTTATPHMTPAIWTDYLADITKGNWINHPFTVLQYNIMKAWRDGNFVNDWVGAPSPGTSVTPDGLTRAALENCNGGPFFPGIETSYLTRDQYPFVEPFRLDGLQLQAGDLTKQNAVPWQADFYDCDYQTPLSWWPTSRPEDVYVAGSKKAVAWEVGIKSWADMVNKWSTLGFLVQSGNSVLST